MPLSPPSIPKLQFHAVVASELKRFAKLKKNTLYRVADDLQFPLVQMFYKSTEDVLIGIQVTFAETHATPVSAIEALYKRLRLPEGTRIRVLMVVAPPHIRTYASKQPYQFVSDLENEVSASKAKKALVQAKNIEFATLQFCRQQ